MVNYCANCGKCCWDWKGGDPTDRCRHLSADFRTCSVYANLAEVQPCCAIFPVEPSIAVDLPEDCGFVVYWKSIGLI